MRAIDVIREAKDIYMSGMQDCMCGALHSAIGTGWCSEIEYIKENIPLFCHSVAVENFGADGVEEGYWWSLEDLNVRIKYFDWLIERYRDSVCGEDYPDM